VEVFACNSKNEVDKFISARQNLKKIRFFAAFKKVSTKKTQTAQKTHVSNQA